MIERLKAVVERVQAWRIMRTLRRYGDHSGPILASGLAYRALFASFAALWVAFAIAGTVVAVSAELQEAVLAVIAQTVPGLVDVGEGGAVDARALINARVFGVTGAIALVGLLLTALGFLHAVRGAVRQLFDLPPAPEHAILSRLRDLLLALAFGLLILASAALSVIGTQATAWTLEIAGIGSTTIAVLLGRSVSLLVMFALDAVTLGAAFRVLSELAIPWRHLRTGALLGAGLLGALKISGGLLLGGASSNPLIASFAVIVGLLIWFNLACQVILIGAAWIATGTDDAGEIVDHDGFEQRLEAARALVREHGMGEDEPSKRGIWARLAEALRARGRG